MKVLFVLALTLVAAAVAPANAEDRRALHAGPAQSPATGTGCTGGVWPAFAACKNVYQFKDYADCHSASIKMGWRTNDIWWYCSSLGFKT
ncbi:hypothetical protein [Bradyrhizobium sp. ORS 285]|uniref:hypothetical protein n=1 Tax=Bradyrhizobium sp. ORS 285 TaxID=115808 RepID=UPI00111195E9|nr:hypothetical protein [Bradyrhizobium sp. ORS 285]